MKKIYTIAAAAAMFLSAAAQTEVMKIELTDGTVQTIAVETIHEITFGTDENPDAIAGTYTGEVALTVAGMYTYTTTTAPVITENADGTINFTWPEYRLENTMMGNLTLGTYTISNIPYDSERNAYFLDYSNAGLTQHFKAEGGSANFDNDYVLGTTSTITIEETDAGIKVTNPFKLGAMPLPISASFEGAK